MAARAVALPLPIFAAKLAVFALGSFLLHSAACVLNDICDIEFDRQVGEQCNIELLDMTSTKYVANPLFLAERTRDRPLPAGVVSVRGATILCVSLLVPVFGLLSYGDSLRYAILPGW